MKIFAILATIVVIAAGAGVALYLNNDSQNNSYHSQNTDGRLMIFGNANNDDYIDQGDITALEKIIANPTEVKDHPLADANQDGTVDQRDIDMVKQMINREKMTLYYLNGNGDIKSVDYPLERVVVVGTNAMLTVRAIGAVSAGKVVGVTGEKNKDAVLFSDVKDIAKVSTSILVANPEAVVDIGDVDAIITMNSAVYVKNESTFTNSGIEVIRVACSNNEQDVSTALTLGYMMQLEERANKYAQFCDGVLDHVSGIVANLIDDQKKTCLCVTMTNSVSGTPSDYYKLTELAGGKNLADWNEVTQKYTVGGEWLLKEKYQADYIVHYSQWSYSPDTDYQSIYDKLSVNFTEMDAYQEGNYVLINGYLPDIVRLAYTAAVFYPDLFGEDYGDQVHQQYIDAFVDNLHEADYKVTDASFVISQASLRAT
ncbi:MAG: ABC transporter substrate-binding protein [Candidatus Methanomethylophilus sp.]|nr:ABC transporter substrate-binding protein [Methanomethylophilus sp.]